MSADGARALRGGLGGAFGVLTAIAALRTALSGDYVATAAAVLALACGMAAIFLSGKSADA